MRSQLSLLTVAFALLSASGCRNSFDAEPGEEESSSSSEAGTESEASTSEGEESSTGSSSSSTSESGDGDSSESGDGDGESSGDGDAESTSTGGDGDGDGDGDGEPTLPCADELIVGTGEGLGSVDSSQLDATLAGSCGGGNSTEAVFEWVAPTTGYYEFSTEGSDFDTVLYLLEAACDGNEVGCHADLSSTDQSSELLAPVTQGTTYLVVVDGDLGAEGNAVINISEVSCPDLDLAGQPLPVTVNSTTGTNEYDGACGGTGNNELSFLWSPPSDGFYRIDATPLMGGDLLPALHLEAGPLCGGDLLSCNAQGQSGGPLNALPATVWRELDANEPYTIVVDSAMGSGPVELDITQVGATCPTTTIDPWSGIQDVPLSDAVNDNMTTSCGNNYGVDIVAFDLPDLLYRIDAVSEPAGCSYDVVSDSPVAIAVIEGNCEGRELSCVEATESNGQYSAFVDVPNDGGTYTLVISPLDGQFSGNVDIWPGCFTP